MRMMQAGCAIGVFTFAVTSGLWGWALSRAEQAQRGNRTLRLRAEGERSRSEGERP